MRRMRKGWLIGIGAVGAVLVAATLLAAGVAPRLLGGLAGEDAGTTAAVEGSPQASGPWTVPGLDSGKAADESLGSRDEAAETEGQTGLQTETAALYLAADGRRLVRTADMALVVDGHDVGAAVARVVAITESLGGYVLSSFTGTPGGPVLAYPEDDLAVGDVADDTAGRSGIGTATVTVRVPSASFEPALRRFARLGQVEYESTSTQDVSDQMVDLEARLRHARAVERRLLRFLDQTDTIKEMLAVQDRLDQVQLEIEQLGAQIEALREVVAFSTVTVTLRAEGDPTPVIGAGGGVWDNFVDAWRVLGRSAAVLLKAVAAALPFVIVGGGIAVAAWYVARRLSRRRDHGAGAEGTA